MMCSNKPSNVLFSFGVIADVQYADSEDGHSFDKKATRRYRNSVKILEQAVAAWNEEKSLDFIAQLGDIIDGKNKAMGHSKRALETCLREFEKCNCKDVVHCIGNHELYNFNRLELNALLGVTRKGQYYYSFSPKPKWKIIVLDPYDISLMGASRDEYVSEARDILKTSNPNDVFAPNSDWMHGLKGPIRRFVPYNGAVSRAQLDWLAQELAQAESASERVIVLCHVSILPASCQPSCLVWNYEQILKLLEDSTSVVAVLAGHDHSGGYALSDAGVHHVTFPSPLECELHETAYGVIDVMADKIVVRGSGKVESMELPLRTVRAPTLAA